MNYITSKVFWQGVALSLGPSQVVGICGLAYAVPQLVYQVNEYIKSKNAFENMQPSNGLYEECKTKFEHHSTEMYKYARYSRAALKALAPLGGAIWVATSETGPNGAFPRRKRKLEDLTEDQAPLTTGTNPSGSLTQRKVVQFAS